MDGPPSPVIPTPIAPAIPPPSAVAPAIQPVAAPVTTPAPVSAPVSAPTPTVKLTPDEAAIGVAVADQNVVIPAGSYRALIDHAAERGAAEVESKVQLRLAALGFKSIDALIQSAEDSARAPAATPPVQEPIVSDIPGQPAAPAPTPIAAAPAPVPAPTPIAPPQSATPNAQPGAQAGAPPAPGQPGSETDRTLPEHIRRRLANQRAQYESRTSQLTQQYTTEQARAQQLEQTNVALQEEMKLKLELSKLGVTDLDFAWYSLSQHLKALAADKSPEGVKKLAEFQAAAWAEEQRKTRPFIFGQMPVAANTGAVGMPGAQPAPAQPGAPQVTAAAAGTGAFDARTATPADFEKRMRERGMSYAGSKPFRG